MSLSVILVSLGIVGLVVVFVSLLWLTKKQKGMPTWLFVIFCLVFLVSVFLTAFGDKIKVISSISSGAADDR